MKSGNLLLEKIKEAETKKKVNKIDNSDNIQKEVRTINKKLLEVLTFIIYFFAMIIFELGYCNFYNVEYLLNGNMEAFDYNFSLCRIIVYIVFMLILFCTRKKFIDEAVLVSKNKYKRIMIYTYFVLAIIVLIASLVIIIINKNHVVIQGMSIGMIAVLMGMIFTVYV